MRRWLVVASLAGALAQGVAAQEPVRQPVPEPTAPSPRPSVRAIPNGHFELYIQRRARLGVSVNFLARDTDSIGAMINGVTPNGPAARAGLRTGDIITSLNGRPLVVRGARVARGQSAPGVRLSEFASQLDAGDTVTVQYRRGSERRVVSLVAGDEPAMAWTTPDGGFTYLGDDDDLPPRTDVPMPSEAPEGWRVTVRLDSLGNVAPSGRREPFPRTPMPAGMMVPLLDSPLAQLELAPLNSELGRYFGTAEGILVIRTPRGSRLGLQGGDVILTVDGREPDGPGHLLRILRSYAPAEPVRFEVLRLKKRETIVGTLGQ